MTTAYTLQEMKLYLGRTGWSLHVTTISRALGQGGKKEVISDQKPIQAQLNFPQIAWKMLWSEQTKTTFFGHRCKRTAAKKRTL